IAIVLRPAIFDRQVPAFDEAHFAQAFAERRRHIDAHFRRIGAEKTDHWQRRLLRARGEWPRCGAAESSDELAPPHSITSSAVICTIMGTVRPSVLAVFRLSTNSNLVDCMTGRSAGFSPLRIRPA